MRIGSLFSGIGGLELGLEWAGLGETVWQVEIDEGCRDILSRHWPSAKRFSDITKVGACELEPVDLICGGFPCQDLSSAGKKKGLAGTRSGLWFEYLRVVQEIQPSWVVVENVASGANAWVDVAVGGLEQCGYTCLPIPLSAADVGAPHLRARVFVLACHPDKDCKPVGPLYAQMAQLSGTARGLSVWTEQPHLRVDDGATSRMGRLGNAVVPQCAEVVGHVIRELNRT